MPKQNYLLSQNQKAQVVLDYLNGMTQGQIAAQCHVTQGAIYGKAHGSWDKVAEVLNIWPSWLDTLKQRLLR